jgi:hypothetical protein
VTGKRADAGARQYCGREGCRCANGGGRDMMVRCRWRVSEGHVMDGGRE